MRIWVDSKSALTPDPCHPYWPLITANSLIATGYIA